MGEEFIGAHQDLVADVAEGSEFHRGMKPEEYDQLTGTQRAWLIVGAMVALLFQTIACYAFGLLLHQLPH